MLKRPSQPASPNENGIDTREVSFVMPIDKKCLVCDKIFIVPRDTYNKKYCSKECRKKKEMKNDKGQFLKTADAEIVKCLNCGNEFRTTFKESFCKAECYREYKKNNAKGRQKPETEICLFCGKEFNIEKGLKGKRKYCSHECYYAYMKSLTGSSEHPYYNKVERICMNCGKKFLTKPAKVKYGEGKFCSKNCHGAHTVVNANKQDTKIEIILEAVLMELSLVYEKQKPIGWYVCDFYIPKYNLVIEADGDYWHRIEKVRKRDKRKNSYLLGKGYKLLRIWESDIHKNPKEIIVEYIKKLTA